jgi:hypothetical protein
MSSHWNLFTPSNRYEEQKKATPRSMNTGMLSEPDDATSRQGDAEKFYERKKRSFMEMERGQSAMKKGSLAPIQNLTSGAPEPMKLKNVEQGSNLPEMSLKAKTVKPPISMSRDFSKTSRYEAIKVLSVDTLETYMNKDEKLIDTDRNIGSSTVVSSKFLKKY